MALIKIATPPGAPPAYSPEWMRRWRPAIWERMLGLVRETSLIKAKRAQKRMAELQAKIEPLAEELASQREVLRANCPHPVEDQKYERGCQSDTLGNYSSSQRNSVDCGRCNTPLISWFD